MSDKDRRVAEAARFDARERLLMRASLAEVVAHVERERRAERPTMRPGEANHA